MIPRPRGHLLMGVLGLTCACAARVGAQEPNPPAGQERPESEAAKPSAGADGQPASYDGPWSSREKLTGSWFGLRDDLRDHGVVLDLSATLYYQGITRGGLDERFEFGGRNDYVLNVDGQKAGLWPGFFINLHGESVYGDSVNRQTGAVVPVNIGRAHPDPVDDKTALTAVKITQALSEDFLVYAGKINTIDNVQQPFMPGRGFTVGFMNAALVWNPILGRTMNYATLGAGAALLVNGEPVATLTVYDTHDDTTTSGFEHLGDNGAIIYPTVTVPTRFFDLPGHHSLWGAYSSGRYEIVQEQSLNQIPPGLPPPTTLTRGTWWITYVFDQALWVDAVNAKRAWGVFGNVGISDGKPNPIRWSAIGGVGGSSPIPCRDLDTFGVAYYYLGLSDDFKDVARAFIPVRDERGFEFFYDVAVTPWCHITADLQVITPLLKGADTAVVPGLRLKIDF